LTVRERASLAVAVPADVALTVTTSFAERRARRSFLPLRPSLIVSFARPGPAVFRAFPTVLPFRVIVAEILVRFRAAVRVTVRPDRSSLESLRPCGAVSPLAAALRMT
jgi:hypothetical protein